MAAVAKAGRAAGAARFGQSRWVIRQGVKDEFRGFLEMHEAAKLAIERRLPFTPDWLHLPAGPLIMAAAALALRRPVASLIPWLVVLAFALFNEAVDLLGTRRIARHHLVESGLDIAITMAIPTLILFIGALRRSGRPG